MSKYTLLTTFPKDTSANVGDKLITHSAMALIKNVDPEAEFLIFFRETNLEDYLEQINKTKAIIMPGFGIRNEIYPKLYKLTRNLADIKIPLIPLGAGWKSVPGDFFDLNSFNFSDSTIQFLKEISSQNTKFSCRDYYTCQVLENLGIKNTIMTGDCAWYNIEYLGKKLKRPSKINNLVFTPPNNVLFHDQASNIITILNELYPNATKFCSFHGKIRDSDDKLVELAEKQNFVIKDVSNKIENLEFYKDMDLHIGYRCHGHLAFLQKRIPSILINEDGRGVSFSYTSNTKTFNAFSRSIKNNKISMRLIKYWLRNFLKSKNKFENYSLNQAISNNFLHLEIKQFLKEEKNSQFRRYLGVPQLIDDTFKTKMKPFLESFL